MDIKHLNQVQVARRWGISERTLERWRWLRKGPPFLKIGGHVAYRLSDIEAFEAAQLRQGEVTAPA
jgi:Helix-turn-helix domain